MNTVLKYFFSILIIFTLSNAAIAALKTGETIPNPTASLTNFDGKKTSISKIKTNKGMMVIFTCNTCPYAKAWEDRIVEIGNEAVKNGLGVALINSNDPRKKTWRFTESIEKKSR